MVHNMLPSGKTVQYAVAVGEEIPSIPVKSDLEPGSAITATTDAIVSEEDRGEVGRGELLVPFAERRRAGFTCRNGWHSMMRGVYWSGA